MTLRSLVLAAPLTVNAYNDSCKNNSMHNPHLYQLETIAPVFDPNYPAIPGAITGGGRAMVKCKGSNYKVKLICISQRLQLANDLDNCAGYALGYYTKQGDLEMVKKLMPLFENSDNDVNQPYERRMSPLEIATQKGFTEIMSEILKNPKANHYGLFALEHYAGTQEVKNILLNEIDFKTEFVWAIEKPSSAYMKKLIQAKTPDAQHAKELTVTALKLRKCQSDEDLTIVKKLLEIQTDLKAEIPFEVIRNCDDNPYRGKAQAMLDEMFNKLTEGEYINLVETNKNPSYQNNLLDYATSQYKILFRKNMIKLLGYYKIKNGNVNEVRNMLTKYSFKNQDIDTWRHDGQTALMVACEQSNPEMVQMLLSHLEANAGRYRYQLPKDHKNDALFYAFSSTEEKKHEVVKMLLKYYKSHNIVMGQNNNQLGKAFNHENPKLFKVLLDHLSRNGHPADLVKVVKMLQYFKNQIQLSPNYFKNKGYRDLLISSSMSMGPSKQPYEYVTEQKICNPTLRNNKKCELMGGVLQRRCGCFMPMYMGWLEKATKAGDLTKKNLEDLKTHLETKLGSMGAAVHVSKTVLFTIANDRYNEKRHLVLKSLLMVDRIAMAKLRNSMHLAVKKGNWRYIATLINHIKTTPYLENKLGDVLNYKDDNNMTAEKLALRLKRKNIHNALMTARRSFENAPRRR